MYFFKIMKDLEKFKMAFNSIKVKVDSYYLDRINKLWNIKRLTNIIIYTSLELHYFFFENFNLFYLFLFMFFFR